MRAGSVPGWSLHVAADLAQPAERAFASSPQCSPLLDGDAPIHALVNNAGVSPKTDYKERLGVLHGEVDSWRDVFESNFSTPRSSWRAASPGGLAPGARARSSTSPRSPGIRSIPSPARPTRPRRRRCRR